MAQTITFDLSKFLSPSTESNNNVVSEVKREMPKRCECEGCKKKLILADIKCKCNKYFCSMHRFANNHKCEFDYRLDGINILKKNLIEVKGTTLEKI
jgi:predicted nucleic acid binding AN1-type Zn finger protein